jgi:hypothetical protein
LLSLVEQRDQLRELQQKQQEMDARCWHFGRNVLFTFYYDIYIYIYIERERDMEGDIETVWPATYIRRSKHIHSNNNDEVWDSPDFDFLEYLVFCSFR